jgi:hypothetical protein
MSAPAERSAAPRPLKDTLRNAAHRALGGGLAGGIAMAANVVMLMPLRTVMNSQYRYGGSFVDTVRKLNSEGGARRFYRCVLCTSTPI